MVSGTCLTCHKTNRITRSSGYSQDHWEELISTMIDLSATPAALGETTRYLATHFPPTQKRAPRLIRGKAQISFKEWAVPTLGQRSRDPIEAADGTIWWAGQWGNLIGRINPKTGEMKEFPLPDMANPHSVTLDKTGNVWYTGNKNGTLWFTLQHSNMVGRLNPVTGAIKLVTMKTRKSKPYGIKIEKKGVPWVACNGSNCLVKIDPVTMALTEIKLPLPKTKVRRLDIDGNGMIWYVNSGLGRLGRYNPKSGTIKEWPSPSGPKSHPYAIAVVDGIVWYNESRRRPDALVRFNPKTQKFQSWAIPSGGIYAGIIRHMRPTRAGNLLIHQSSTIRITLVTIKRLAITQ